jgi:choline kinase/phosphatidylglycerophosphate synthase
MQAIILAAGEGSRMNDADGPPKILLDLHGQTFLEYHLATLSSLGITSFVVVTGYRGKIVEQFIAHKGLARRFELSVVQNDRWREGNASSILAARPSVSDGRFVVAMGDHLFDPDGLRGFLKVRGDFVGVFDSAPRLVDVAEATKAMSHRGHITALGKELAEFNYVDAGIFICSQRIFPFVEECLADGLGTFNEVKRRWTTRYVLHVFDCRGTLWMDVDTPEDLEEARRQIGPKLKKPRDGPVARLLNRRLSMPVSLRLVDNTPITPNQITVGAFAFALISAALFCWGPGTMGVIAGLFAQFASILDGCDGEVARLRHRSTAYGGWLDAVLDRLADALLVGSMAYGAWQFDRSAWIWPIGFMALMGSFAVSYTEARYVGAFGRSPRFGGGLPAKRDTRLLLIMLGGVTGQFMAALGLIALLSIAEVVRRLWVTTGRFLRLRQVDSATGS